MTCELCGQEERLELVEYWGPGEFLVETCCEGLEAELRENGFQDVPRKVWKAAFGEADMDIRAVWGSSLGALVADFGLELGPVDLKTAKAFVADHHRHRKNPPCSWRWGHGLYGQTGLVAVAMVGRPVARLLDAAKVVEVNRVCVRDQDPAGMAWNACSMLYGAAVREARRRGFERVITYTREDELGTTLRAAGFVATHRTRAESWNRRSRPRQDMEPPIAKVRWERSCS